MSRWWVITPEFPYTEVVDPSIGGPSYNACDVIEVEADTKRDAVSVGVKAMLADRRHYEYCRSQQIDGLCPYSGVRAELVEEPQEVDRG